MNLWTNASPSLEIPSEWNTPFPGGSCLSSTSLYWLSPLPCFPLNRTSLLALESSSPWEPLFLALLLEEAAKTICLNRTAAHLVSAQRYIPGPSLTELWELMRARGSGWLRALAPAKHSCRQACPGVLAEDTSWSS